ncbi:cell division protein FtsQ/DivIB [Bartonella bacilliformis]|uniref:cell division protein FtsQ/DivIB n=1 Tax=Bartonella bacilliformis TaxID=774 RepID=UPI0018B07240|nr:cell division protein FtsQ/DivIB [Bartonella bacilliformis]
MDSGGRIVYALNVEKTGFLRILSVTVLQRLYRRVFWFLFKCVAGIDVPRHAGSFAVLSFFFLSILYSISSGGYMNHFMKVAVSNSGFLVTHVDMSGNKHMMEQDILKILGLDEYPSMISFDIDRARFILEQQPWVRLADVQKIYPNRLRISLVEREPYAVWQHNGEINIIDDTGYVIAPFQADLVQNLSFVVGQGAHKTAKLFIQALSVYPQLQNRIRAYVRVGDRRWDLFLANGVRIMLPENGAIERLASFIEQGVAKDLFSRDVLNIDLRLSDRITVSLSDQALTRRRAVVLEEERLLKMLKAGSV